MTLTKQTKFVLAVSLQLTIIFAIVISKVVILAGGTDILLRIEPVDPRDLLRGDFITFQYKISNLDPYLFRDGVIKNGDTVYVMLRPEDKYWVAYKVSKRKPEGTSGIFIRGRVSSGGMEGEFEPFDIPRRFGPPGIHVVYGIEEFFIPEGSGSGLNLWRRDDEASAKVAVDEDGRAVLKQIYVNGRPWPQQDPG